MRIRKSKCIELDGTNCCIGKFNMAFRSDHSLLFGIEVQLVVFYITIEIQVVFEILLTLVTGQLAVTS